METILIITEPQQISSLLDMIHDWFFDADKIMHNKETNTVTIAFTEKPGDLPDPKTGVTLTVFNVKQIRIKDTEKIGYYDLNKLTYDGTSKVLKISCGTPLEIDMSTDSLLIEVRRRRGLNNSKICLHSVREMSAVAMPSPPRHLIMRTTKWLCILFAWLSWAYAAYLLLWHRSFWGLLVLLFSLIPYCLINNWLMPIVLDVFQQKRQEMPRK